MATIVNNPPAQSNNNSGNGMGFLLGVIILIVFVGMVLFFVLPYIRNFSGFSAQVNVPKNVNVNVNTTK